MGIIDRLKNRNRVLLEMHTGVLFWAMAATLAGLALPLDAWGAGRVPCLCGVWAAAAAALLATVHMERCLELALELDEKTAGKLLTRGYLTRYAVFVLVAVFAAAARFPNPVALCLGYILLVKAAAYSQPFTHKLYNKLFHETDPVAGPVADEEWDGEKIKGG